MKKLCSCLVALCLFSSLAWGQSAASQPADQANPQIAFRLFSDYVDKKGQEANPFVGGVLVASLGLGCFVAGGLSLAYGDQFFPSQGWTDPEAKWIAGSGFLAVGGICVGAGIGLMNAPSPDLRVQYPLVFSETDPVVQEALAASYLLDLARQGRDRRVSGGLFEIGLPIVNCLGAILYNCFSNKDWNYNLDKVGGINLFGILDGLLNIFVYQSEEERLYDQYLSAKSAYFGAAR
jgi:hypothetical protein